MNLQTCRNMWKIAPMNLTLEEFILSERWGYLEEVFYQPSATGGRCERSELYTKQSWAMACVFPMI